MFLAGLEMSVREPDPWSLMRMQVSMQAGTASINVSVLSKVTSTELLEKHCPGSNKAAMLLAEVESHIFTLVKHDAQTTLGRPSLLSTS